MCVGDTHLQDPCPILTLRKLKDGLWGSGEMGQLVKVLAAKSEDLSSSSGTHMLEGEKKNSQKLPPDLHMNVRTKYDSPPTK